MACNFGHRKPLQQQVYFLGEYEKAETDYLYHVLKPGDTFIDIGANIGLFSLNASKIVGNSGKVYSFEAFKPNYIQFKKHIAQNKIQNIKAENKAVSNDSTPIEIRYNDSQNNIGMASAFLEEFTITEKVEAVTLDQYLSENSLEKVDLIKIDIEGGEYNALLGMAETLAKYKPQIIIEMNSETLAKSNGSEKQLLNLLYGYHYQLKQKLTTAESSYNAVFECCR